MLVTNYQDLIMYLRMRRIMLDMSQPVVADLAGISTSSYQKYEQGQISVHLPRLIELCDALDCQLAIVPLENQTPEFIDMISSTIRDDIDYNLILKNRRQRGGAKDSKHLQKIFKATGYGRGTARPTKKS